MDICPKCKSTKVFGVEYGHRHPEHFDGISEWKCGECGYRQGRWTKNELIGTDIEKRFGNGE